MIAVKDAIEMTLNEATRLGTAEVDLKDASGYILAEDIFSDIDMPPFEKSSMDGYAFKAADCQNNSTVLDVVGSIPAGVYPDFEIEKGQAAKIMTGAPLPEGADSVQMVESTIESALMISLFLATFLPNGTGSKISILFSPRG